MDLTITPPPGYRESENARWTWVSPDCDTCGGTGVVWAPVYDHDIYEYGPYTLEDGECDCVWTPDPHILKELDRRYHSWSNPDRAREAWESAARGLGPRQPGGRYWNGYWRKGYTVVSVNYSFHDGDPASPRWTVTVQWDDGRQGTHSTPWDPGRDSCRRPPAHHAGPAPAPPELRHTNPTPTTRRSLWSLLTSRAQ